MEGHSLDDNLFPELDPSHCFTNGVSVGHCPNNLSPPPHHQHHSHHHQQQHHHHTQQQQQLQVVQQQHPHQQHHGHTQQGHHQQQALLLPIDNNNVVGTSLDVPTGSSSVGKQQQMFLGSHELMAKGGGGGNGNGGGIAPFHSIQVKCQSIAGFLLLSLSPTSP
jgi:hypothetical protein